MSCKKNTPPLKKEFIKILFVVSSVPFFISIILLIFIFKNSNEKVELANRHIERSQELEVLDSFHKVLDAMYQVTMSRELDDYYSSTIDNEKFQQEQLTLFISQVRNSMIYENSLWGIYGSHGNLLFSVGSRTADDEIPTIREQMGVTLDNKKENISFVVPLIYRYNNKTSKIQTMFGFIFVSIPIASVQAVHPNLLRIDKVPRDLSVANFTTEFKKRAPDRRVIYFFYFYAIVFITINCAALIFGLNTLKNKIIRKINFLRFRVGHKMRGEKNSQLQNEVEALSETFDRFSRYTEFLQYEIQKASQFAAIGNTAHTIAHDIRQPFSKLFMFIEQISQCSSLPEIKQTIQDAKIDLQSSSQYLEHLLKEIMEAGIMQVNTEPCIKAEKLILTAFEQLTLKPNSTQIQIHYQLNHNCYLNIDFTRIMRVFVNLIQNAMDAMQGTGNMWFYSQRTIDNKFVLFTVGNDNSFIEANDIPHLFEPFFTKNKKHGNGLGLAISEKIISLHGGQIECRSSREKGVEFSFTLPAGDALSHTETDALPRSLSSSPQMLSHPKTHLQSIVIIDDDPLILRNWKRSIKEVSVFTFSSPEEFFAQIEQEPIFISKIDLLITDYYFSSDSKIDCFGFMKQVRNFYTKKIFLSTDAILEQTEEKKREFNFCVLQKRIYSLDELKSFF